MEIYRVRFNWGERQMDIHFDSKETAERVAAFFKLMLTPKGEKELTMEFQVFQVYDREKALAELMNAAGVTKFDLETKGDHLN